MVSTPITLLILLGALCYGVWWGYKEVTATVPGPTPQACVTQPMTELTTADVTVNVYNGGSLRGLAGRVADTLHSGGFVVGKVGNSTTKVGSILIIGAAADNPEVQLVAARFTNPEIQADARPDHTVDVVLGNSYVEAGGMVAEPPASIQIPSGTVCLPAPTPTATPTPAVPPEGTQPAGQPT
ncbi:MAG: LytR C-terminal domain-containing protein [Propionibacteriaceae bacterium]|jgi:hypothetical protein|nr:LytR C-terminal domain-containing protein [Propionibacteriaceae bacterium]